MKHARLLFSAMTLAMLAAAAPSADRGPEIRTTDIDRFYAIYDAAGGKPDASQLQHDYLDKGSAGLAAFASLRRITGERIAAAISQRPSLYTDARRCAATLPAVRKRLAMALGRLAKSYPGVAFPPVTLAIGRGKPVGTANANGVMIGLEALCAVDFMNPDPEDRFVHVIAHEYAHVFQARARTDATDDPGTSVLAASLVEGGAELVAEVISGSVSYRHLLAATRGREKLFETAFVADRHETAMGSKWLYNGVGTTEWPGDLGYWIGYRITKAYYQRARDKQAALRDILAIRDPQAFLAASGWHPGMTLD